MLPYRELIEAAIQAPSPDNNQPWQFVAQDETLFIYSDPARGLPSDVGSMFCWMALGAAAENACIAASHRGLVTEVVAAERPPLSGAPDTLEPVAELRFRPGGVSDPLFPHLATRCTSRKTYRTSPVEPQSLERLGQSLSQLPSAQVHWLTDRRAIRSLAWLIADSDRVRFEYQPFHEELYKQLRLTVQEAERTRDGLDLRTLELPPGTPLMLRWLRPWRRMRWIHRLGLGRLLTAPSVLSVIRSGAVGAITVSARNADQYLEGGRAFQRVWLAATAEQLSVHPLGSLPIFLAHVENAEGCQLTPGHQQKLRSLGERFRTLLPEVKDRPLVMLFRLGFGSPPSQRSLRRTPDEMMMDRA